jgi:hypothetical protein
VAVHNCGERIKPLIYLIRQRTAAAKKDADGEFSMPKLGRMSFQGNCLQRSSLGKLAGEILTGRPYV